jgi:hypothetical protein
MKPLICAFSILLVTSLLAQVVSTREWKATIAIVDETGRPVSGATVSVMFSYFSSMDERISTNITELSDTNGMFQASHAYTGAPDMLFRAAKDGYYTASQHHDLGDHYSAELWNPSVRLLLRKVANPIAMRAKRVDDLPPAIGKPIGFDLTAGDWVAPYGTGSSADIVFRWDYTERSRLDYDGKLTVSFPNAGDGIQEYSLHPTEAQSALRSPREAPTVGYGPNVERVNSSHPPEPVKWDFDQSRQYFFRVRTVLDERGNVKSAQYGKIYGDFMHFTYYLNATPNDRNVEFDPKQNLIGGQKVADP